ncbi:15783_t:CDS:2, partial [Cetraspora pellucida]
LTINYSFSILLSINVDDSHYFIFIPINEASKRAPIKYQINLPVAQTIIANKAILSRYFVQRLLLHFGKLDNDLVTLKMEYNSNSGRVNITLIQNLKKRIRPPWASDLEMSVFSDIVKMVAEQFGEMQLSLKGNDMELFHFLTAGPHAEAPKKLRDFDISKFKENIIPLDDIIICVVRKLELENESIKKLNLTKNEKNFDQKLTKEEGIRLLIEIMLDRLACPITKKLTGDFFVLICGHSIGHQFKNKCPFCKVNIESESVYYLSRNAILKGLDEFLAKVYSEETNSLNSLKLTTEQETNSLNSLKLITEQETHSKAMLFAFEKAEIAGKKHEHSIVIMWLTRVLYFYPKSYSIQCRRASAFINLNMHLKAINDLTTAIKLKPSKSLAYIYRSKIYIFHKNFDNALHDMDEALRIEPNNEHARLEKERICEYKGQTGNIDRPINNFMQLGLSDEILINIFKFVRFPLNLILTCKSWYNISSDHMVRAEWIVYQYGRAHALFYAIRLGSNFINSSVAKAIVTNGAIISSYFIKRLLLHFGKFDQQLETLKMEHNVNNQNITNVRTIQQQNSKTPWASDLNISVFIYLLQEADKQFAQIELSKKGNDMELFHFLSAGPHVINDARAILDKNKALIEDLILKLKDDIENTISRLTNKDTIEQAKKLFSIGRFAKCKNIIQLKAVMRQTKICVKSKGLVASISL